MITVIKSEDRYEARHGWLKSYHLFSFADYYDPYNMNFGSLRVFNDDYISGENGFGQHPHHDMEIVTVMLSGELTHTDTMGNKKKIREGEVQYMSAGTGVMHSEVNESKEEVHLYQIWFEPKERGLVPSYNQKNFSLSRKKNLLQKIANSETDSEAIHLHTDVSVFLFDTDSNVSLTYNLEDGHGLFLYISKGSLSVNGNTVSVGDQVRITGEPSLIIEAEADTFCILIDVLL
jgi:redox-sensitive bicupin YhaK (pirin superfamily)